MKVAKFLVLLCLLVSAVTGFSQNPEPVDYFVRYTLNGVPYKILFVTSNDSKDVALFLKYLHDSTVSVRGFGKQDDSIVLHDNNAAEFSFYFSKANKEANYKEIHFTVDSNFSLSPKEYKIADYDEDNTSSFEIENNGYDGLAGLHTLQYTYYSIQYTWSTNRRPAKWTITKVDPVAKTISGTFSFAVTYTKTNGKTDARKRDTFTKVIEDNITDGAFCLPYTIIAN